MLKSSEAKKALEEATAALEEARSVAQQEQEGASRLFEQIHARDSTSKLSPGERIEAQERYRRARLRAADARQEVHARMEIEHAARKAYNAMRLPEIHAELGEQRSTLDAALAPALKAAKVTALAEKIHGLFAEAFDCGAEHSVESATLATVIHAASGRVLALTGEGGSVAMKITKPFRLAQGVGPAEVAGMQGEPGQAVHCTPYAAVWLESQGLACRHTPNATEEPAPFRGSVPLTGEGRGSSLESGRPRPRRDAGIDPESPN